VESSRQIAGALLEAGYARRLLSKVLIHGKVKRSIKKDLEDMGYTDVSVQLGGERFSTPIYTMYDVTIYLYPPPMPGLEDWEISGQIHADILHVLNNLRNLGVNVEGHGGIVIRRAVQRRAHGTYEGAYFASATIGRDRRHDPARREDWPPDEEVPF
jgi:hypothetical protein